MIEKSNYTDTYIKLKTKKMKLVCNTMKYDMLIEELKTKVWSLISNQVRERTRSDIDEYTSSIFKIKLFLQSKENKEQREKRVNIAKKQY